jgi:O-antigen ligase
LNRVLNLAAVMAIVGCVQFFTDFDPVVSWRLPGLELNQALTTVVSRSVVSRVASTTLHPIEFGALIAMLFPLALHTALFCDREKRFRRWARLGLITFAIPLSVSRTAVVVLLIVVLMMWTAWTWGRRLRLVAIGFVFVMAMRALVRGLLGTIIALFTNFGNDPSTKGRTADYTRIWTYVGERPWFGRGLGTFDPILYFFVDNQILITLVTGGIIGLIGMLGVVGTGASVARQVYWHGHDEASRHLGAAIAAGIVGGFCGFYTFDAFAFPVFIGVWFLLVGMAGALWRLEVGPYGRRYTNPRHRELMVAG